MIDATSPARFRLNNHTAAFLPMNISRAASVFTALSLATAAGIVARAGVSTESPFAPRGQAAASAIASNTPIELRGITADEQGERFAIYDPVKKEGAWVRIDDKDHSFVVRSYDAATKRIVVDYQGKSQTIVLVEPKFGPGKTVAAPIVLPGVAAQTVAASAAQPMPGRFIRPGEPGGAQQRMQQPSADEAKRLEAIRAEVARRRAQREASAQGAQPPQQ